MTQNHPEIVRPLLADVGDIFSEIDQVDRSIAECIRSTDATLQHSGPQGPGAPTSVFDHDFDDFTDKLGSSLLPNLLEKPKHSPVFDSKSLSTLEEDLDLILQLGEGETTVC
jgi:hypothetical protein